MAKSFADSLNAMASAQASTMSLRNSVALAAEEESWTLHTDYQYTKGNELGYHYEDEHISFVDDKKTVKVNEYQINLTQETNSQYIPFIMNRYYDGIDLVQPGMKLSFYFENIEGGWGERDAVNVEYNDTQIKLGFLVPKEATLIAGKLKFEIHAIGVSPLGGDYVFKTKPNDDIEILESLQGNGSYIVAPDYAENVVEEVRQEVMKAEAASAQAQSLVAQANALNSQTTQTVNAGLAEMDLKIASVEATIKDNIVAELSIQYYTREETDSAIATAIQPLKDDISELDTATTANTADIASLTANLEDNYYKKTETLSTEEIEQKLEEIDVTSQLEQLETKIAGEYYNRNQIDEKLDQIDVSDQLENYYTKDVADSKFAPKSVETTVDNNTSDIRTINSSLISINEELAAIDKSPKTKYRAEYGDVELDDGSTAKYMFTLWKEENGIEEVQDRFQIAGGGGGTGSSITMKVNYVEGYGVAGKPVVYTINDKVILKYIFEGIDSAGDYVSAKASWKIGNRVVLTEEINSGENEVDLTDYVGVGDNKINLTVSHESGASTPKNWTIKIVDLKIRSTFSETTAKSVDEEAIFTFVPEGNVDKTIHFLLDGEVIGTKTSSSAASGISDSYVIPSQEHGAHLFEVYMTSLVNEKTIESNHIMHDIVWFDDSIATPVIGCSTPVIEAMQYNAVNVKYTVFDKTTETPEVSWYVNDELSSTGILNPSDKDAQGFYTFTYKANEPGEFELKVTCRDSEPKIVTVKVEELDIDVTPVTTGLAFDFNPVGYSNSSTNRLWSDGDVAMTVSDNFDWINGGYQIDENGDQYFCVKAGTNAIINYNLFNDAAQTNGKEFKVIFRTKNIRQRDTSFLTCMSDGIGLDMKVEHASVYSSDGALKSLYCEDEIIEYEFNVNKSADGMLFMTYEDGAPNIPKEYTETTSFRQVTPQPITIGSDDCDVHIYRIKAYKTSLTDTDIKNNFIADARNADEMIDRYARNQIYNPDGKIVSTTANGDFNADAIMKSNPQLRYIFLEVPYFTTGKGSKIDGCSVYFRYPAGVRPEDNWDCTGMRHQGQGTSSDSYGQSGRNVDLVMDRDTSKITWIGADGNVVESNTITLTETSYPTDYLNIKVNVASSENANNAQMARRYNENQPFLRYARKKDSRIKDTMEFYNCVLFIRETSEDLTTHTEFADCNWHYYSLGNVGDSKKTDDTRVNNPNDPREFVIESMDVDKPLSAFPTGKENNETCPVSEWKAGNTAYDALYAEYIYDEKGEFKSFGVDSYEFRYEMNGITEEQRETNINIWRDFYTFLATSSDDEIYANLKKYFVMDSVLYYYLFTERYTMVDNRSKNLFFHYGKVYISNAEAVELGEIEAGYYIIDDVMASFNDGYRFDITFGYDFDTSLGIDNTGDLVFSYGKEDTDFYDDTNSKEVFRVSNSRFFCKVRDLFTNELEVMYKNRETAQAWNAESLIKQWDDSQNQFPEELWRLDCERKYKRPYFGTSVDNSIPMGIDKGYLIGKYFGRKKYQRRMFERNQEIYFATKYFAEKAKRDQIFFRGNLAPTGATIKQNYSLTITPYSDMYVCVQYTSTGTPVHKRMKAGQPCTFTNNSETMDFMYIYAASYIQEIGDLSRCYIDDNNFTNGIRLRKLIIGNPTQGYDNPYMKMLAANNNPILEYIDLRNVSGINENLVLTSSGNLKELYAEGTNTPGVIFANGGLLETAHLPAIKSLSMKNLNYVKDLQIAGYQNLSDLTIENCPTVNSYVIVNSSPVLQYLRLIGIDWNSSYDIKDSTLLDRVCTLWGRDGSNDPVDNAVLSGYVYMQTIKQKPYEDYKVLWPDLTIEYYQMIEQTTATFVNYDNELIETQYVEKGLAAVDPTNRTENPKDKPVKPSTTEHEFTFIGWTNSATGQLVTTFPNMHEPMTFVATYSSSIRNYTVTYASEFHGGIETYTAPYGSVVEYEGEIPVYTNTEGQAGGYKYHLFDHWDKSGYVDGDKVINAVFDTCTYTGPSYFEGCEFNDLRPVEKYMLLKLNASGDIKLSDETIVGIEDVLEFQMGEDCIFNDPNVEQTIIDVAEPMTFSGNNYYDTGINLIDEDKNFVIAIDYEFSAGNTEDASLAQCFKYGNSEGFRLCYSNSNPTIKWTDTSSKCATGTNREMIVLRHIKGEPGLHVYMSNLEEMEIGYINLSHTYRDNIIPSTTSLVFGCTTDNDGDPVIYSKGTVYWAKVWYTDLGDKVCRNLAKFTRESISTKMAGYKRKFLADNSGGYSALTFLSNHVIRHKSKMLDSSINTGGYAETYVREWLDARFYNGLPLWMRQLVKEVQVDYSLGNGTSTGSCNCYVYIPAIAALTDSQTFNVAPYTNEERAVIGSKCISYMRNKDARIMLDHLDKATPYWTRSAYATNAKNFLTIEEDGDPASYISSTSSLGIVIEFCM